MPSVSDRSKRPRLYTDDTLERLVAILARAGDGSGVDKPLLERHLGDLFEAVGLSVDDSDEAHWFREFAEAQPTHAEQAKLFRRMACAKNPFADRADYDLALPALNAKARRWWAPRIRRNELGRAHALLGVHWTELSDDERKEVREMARELAQYHQSFVRRGMPFKDDQNTLLDGLADIFVDFARFELHRYDLPHGENARFIRFAHLALRPFFSATEVTPKALTRRWERLKDTHHNSRPSD